MRVDFRRGAVLFTLRLWRGNRPFILVLLPNPSYYVEYSLLASISSTVNQAGQILDPTTVLYQKSTSKLTHKFLFPILLTTHPSDYS